MSLGSKYPIAISRPSNGAKSCDAGCVFDPDTMIAMVAAYELTTGNVAVEGRVAALLGGSPDIDPDSLAARTSCSASIWG